MFYPTTPVNRRMVQIEREKFGKDPHLQIINFITEVRNIPRQGKEGEVERGVMRLG